MQRERENGYWKGICGTGIKTAYARTVPQRVYGRKAAGKPLQKEKENGYWKGICGTGIKKGLTQNE